MRKGNMDPNPTFLLKKKNNEIWKKINIYL